MNGKWVFPINRKTRKLIFSTKSSMTIRHYVIKRQRWVNGCSIKFEHICQHDEILLRKWKWRPTVTFVRHKTTHFLPFSLFPKNVRSLLGWTCNLPPTSLQLFDLISITLTLLSVISNQTIFFLLFCCSSDNYPQVKILHVERIVSNRYFINAIFWNNTRRMDYRFFYLGIRLFTAWLEQASRHYNQNQNQLK